MTDKVILVVLAAALLHAVWNALVKGSSDKTASMVAVVLGHVPFAIVALFFVESPVADSWMWLLFGILLHAGYQLFLVAAYRFGDLSQVYPIARGVAPLLVTLISILFLGVLLSNFQLAAIMLIAIGITSICLVRKSDGALNGNAVVLALITGCFIAGYSLVDGTGARLAESPLGYYSWLTIGNSIVIVLATHFMRRGILRDVFIHSKTAFLVGGGASFVAYALVVWAFTQAPIALVTALRETSIVFALLIGVFHLKERLSLVKVFSTVITLGGAMMLRFSR